MVQKFLNLGQDVGICWTFSCDTPPVQLFLIFSDLFFGWASNHKIKLRSFLKYEHNFGSFWTLGTLKNRKLISLSAKSAITSKIKTLTQKWDQFNNIYKILHILVYLKVIFGLEAKKVFLKEHDAPEGTQQTQISLFLQGGRGVY